MVCGRLGFYHCWIVNLTLPKFRAIRRERSARKRLLVNELATGLHLALMKKNSRPDGWGFFLLAFISELSRLEWLEWYLQTIRTSPSTSSIRRDRYCLLFIPNMSSLQKTLWIKHFSVTTFTHENILSTFLSNTSRIYKEQGTFWTPFTGEIGGKINSYRGNGWD